MALYMNMWMNDMAFNKDNKKKNKKQNKTKKQKILKFLKKKKKNPNLSMWKANTQKTMWNRDLKTRKHRKWSKAEEYIRKQKKKKSKRKKIRVSRLVHVYAWITLRVHNKAWVCNLDHAHMGYYPETLKTQQTE